MRLDSLWEIERQVAARRLPLSTARDLAVRASAQTIDDEIAAARLLTRFAVCGVRSAGLWVRESHPIWYGGSVASRVVLSTREYFEFRSDISSFREDGTPVWPRVRIEHDYSEIARESFGAAENCDIGGHRVSETVAQLRRRTSEIVRLRGPDLADRARRLWWLATSGGRSWRG